MTVSTQAVARSRLAREHRAGFQALQKLLPRRLDDTLLARLDEIYVNTGATWSSNLKRFGSTPVSRLLLAEAAPWSADGTPAYFYGTGGGGLPAAVASAFGLWGRTGEKWPDVLDALAAHGFLLIDSLPFALDYSGMRLRDRPRYGPLISACAMSYVNDHLRRVVRWADEVLVALAYRKNGEAVIAQYRGLLTLPTGAVIPLHPGLIVANVSGNPDVERIKQVFRLH